jgi:hypothetical protein
MISCCTKYNIDADDFANRMMVGIQGLAYGSEMKRIANYIAGAIVRVG